MVRPSLDTRPPPAGTETFHGLSPHCTVTLSHILTEGVNEFSRDTEFREGAYQHLLHVESTYWRLENLKDTINYFKQKFVMVSCPHLLH